MQSECWVEQNDGVTWRTSFATIYQLYDKRILEAYLKLGSLVHKPTESYLPLRGMRIHCMQQVFIKHLLCARYSARCRRYRPTNKQTETNHYTNKVMSGKVPLRASLWPGTSLLGQRGPSFLASFPGSWALRIHASTPHFLSEKHISSSLRAGREGLNLQTLQGGEGKY